MKERNYRMRVYPIDDGTDEVEWIAEFPDLPGCVGAELPNRRHGFDA